ncbi:hypothetical protein A8144_07790 [Mycobacterium leprae 3125609]|nr:hypothetical protein A8144_07790 [Mycobacterium leprae 3125609]
MLTALVPDKPAVTCYGVIVTRRPRPVDEPVGPSALVHPADGSRLKADGVKELAHKRILLYTGTQII